MTDYKPGDVVTLEHDDGSRLVRELEDFYDTFSVLGVDDDYWTLEDMTEKGWRVTDHKPKLEEKTEPGVYLDRDGDAWQLIDHTWYLAGESHTDREPAGSVTRLVPEGSEREAAIREVLEWQNDRFWPEATSGVLIETRRRFGIAE